MISFFFFVNECGRNVMFDYDRPKGKLVKSNVLETWIEVFPLLFQPEHEETKKKGFEN